MPKNKGKKAKGRGYKNGLSDMSKADSAPQSQEEDTLSEGSSIATACADFYHEETPCDSPVETTPLEVVEEKLKEAIEGLTEKNVKYSEKFQSNHEKIFEHIFMEILPLFCVESFVLACSSPEIKLHDIKLHDIKMDCLNAIRKYFLSHWMIEFLENYKETLLDGLEKCLRKGKGVEQAIAADVLAITAVQLGVTGEEEAIFSHFKPYLLTVLLDTSFSVIARSKFAQVLGILAFLGTDDMEEILSCMSAFETTFRGSFLKGDKSVPVVSPAASEMHQNALSSWALLLSVSPFVKVQEFSESVLPRLPELLTSSNVDLRISTGETIALFYEIMRSEDEGHVIKRQLNEKQLISDLKELATDSNKYRAKKDRRQQRSSFRDIVRAVEGVSPPNEQVRFGSEIFYINTWTIKRHYTALKELLGTGVNLHLKENLFLRSIFELGPPQLGGDEKNSKPTHFERHLFNQAMFKTRSRARGKLRDKRTVMH